MKTVNQVLSCLCPENVTTSRDGAYYKEVQKLKKHAIWGREWNRFTTGIVIDFIPLVEMRFPQALVLRYKGRWCFPDY